MVVDLHVCMFDNAFMPLDDISASEAFIGSMGHRTKRILRIERKEYQTY